MKKKLVYLACPYSHPDPIVRARRFEQATKAAARMINEGVFVYSPITHSHPMAVAGDLPLDWEFWRKYDELFMSMCSKMVVLKLDGWKESSGVQAEIEMARAFFEIPVEYHEIQ